MKCKCGKKMEGACWPEDHIVRCKECETYEKREDGSPKVRTLQKNGQSDTRSTQMERVGEM